MIYISNINIQEHGLETKISQFSLLFCYQETNHQTGNNRKKVKVIIYITVLNDNINLQWWGGGDEETYLKSPEKDKRC